MSDRADFKNSIRQLREQVMAVNEQPEATPKTDGMSRSSIKSALTKQTDDAKHLAPPKPGARKTKRQPALEWVMKLMKAAKSKQVSVEFPLELIEMIRRASHGQRMNGKFPGNVREIHNVALIEWLERNGWFQPEELVGEGLDDQNEAA